MTAVDHTALCWFCGSTGARLMRGWTLPTMIANDLRLETPLAGEFATGLFGQGSANSQICERCWRSCRAQLDEVSPEYLTDQEEYDYALTIQDVDRDGGLIEPEERYLRNGCWFGTFAFVHESRAFTGLQLSELFEKGLPLLEPFMTTRDALHNFLAQAPQGPPPVPVSEEMAYEITKNMNLTDDLLTREDRMRVAQLRVWILDASLILDASMFLDEAPALPSPSAQSFVGRVRSLWRRHNS